MPTAIVHLVRHANGTAPFEAFMDACDRFPPGAEHELVLLLKGFDSGDRASRAPYLDRVRASGSGRIVEVDDEGFDLTAYAAAAAQLPHRRVCFLNSFSQPLAGDWLAHLERALDAPGVGAAGATGSWASSLSLAARQAGLPSAYAAAFSDRRALVRDLQEFSNSSSRGATLDWLFAAKMTAANAMAFARFPAAHLRTNAFLIERERFVALNVGRVATKRVAYRFESGRRGMTARLRDWGLDAVVVDRQGVARSPAVWDEADVFWQADQRQLLVADNQTRAYAAATPPQRRLLSRFAWGDRARPA